MGGDAVWFDGDPPRNERESAFLLHLRAGAQEWGVEGLRPEATGVMTVLAPLFVSLDVPGVPSEVCDLQAGYWQSPPYGHGVEGEWSSRGYLLDNHRYDQDGLTLFGLDAAPEQFAEWTASWFLRQLQRPVERLEWLAGNRVIATHWRLADTGTIVARKGAWLRTIKRMPSRIAQIR